MDDLFGNMMNLLNANLGEISIFIFCIGIVIFGHYVLENSINQKTSYFVRIIRLAFLLLALLFIGYSFKLGYSEHHLYNLIGLIAFVLLLGFLRGLLDYWDLTSANMPVSQQNIQNIRDISWNCIVFFGIYTAFMHSKNDLYRWSGYLLCAFNIFRIVKYRFYDDLFKRRMLDDTTSFYDYAQDARINLAQSLFNLLLRSYSYITISYGCIYALMYNGGQPTHIMFDYKNSSGSELIDFIYFSVITLSTVGYGDITPIHWVAKLLCISEILIGYLFIGTLMAMILNRFKMTSQKNT